MNFTEPDNYNVNAADPMVDVDMQSLLLQQLMQQQQQLQQQKDIQQKLVAAAAAAAATEVRKSRPTENFLTMAQNGTILEMTETVTGFPPEALLMTST